MVGIKRTPRNYGGTEPTGKSIGQILPTVLQNIEGRYGDRPDLIVRAWPKVIGEKLAPMTKAVKFVDGVLHVAVKNSTLLSLLVVHEKKKLVESLRELFPTISIRGIDFRIG